jgi:hypothetical protein
VIIYYLDNLKLDVSYWEFLPKDEGPPAAETVASLGPAIVKLWRDKKNER